MTPFQGFAESAFVRNNNLDKQPRRIDNVSDVQKINLVVFAVVGV